MGFTFSFHLSIYPYVSSTTTLRAPHIILCMNFRPTYSIRGLWIVQNIRSNHTTRKSNNNTKVVVCNYVSSAK